MTHVGCPCCQLRFTSATAALLVACPECGRPPQLIGAAEHVVGFRLFIEEDAPNAMPDADNDQQNQDAGNGDGNPNRRAAHWRVILMRLFVRR